jgi:hypothetical protein
VPSINLEDLPPEIQALVSNLNGGRSPIPRPLADLRPPTTARGRLHRPHFEWSADPDPNPPPLGPYPMLFWDAHGIEHRVMSDAELQAKPADWMPSPPLVATRTGADALQHELDALAPEDRAFLLDAQKKQRLQRISDRLAQLTDTAWAALQSSTPPLEAKGADAGDRAAPAGVGTSVRGADGKGGKRSA